MHALPHMHVRAQELCNTDETLLGFHLHRFDLHRTFQRPMSLKQHVGAKQGMVARCGLGVARSGAGSGGTAGSKELHYLCR